MNSNSTESTSSARNSLKPIFYIVLTVILLAGAFLYRGQAALETDMQDLAAEKDQLQKELAAAHSELEFFKTGDFSKKVAKTVKTKPTPKIVIPETLYLQEPTVSTVSSGLAARFSFEPDEGISLPEQITLVVRIPSNVEGKILSLKPIDAAGYSKVEFLINPQGDLGMIEGSPADLSALEFELTVSAPVTATVRGSKGIKAFEIDIAAHGCSVRKL